MAAIAQQQLPGMPTPPASDQPAKKAAGLQPPIIPQTPIGVEVATVMKGEFLSPITIYQFPNVSRVINYRSEGQGIRFYNTMLGSDSDLRGFYRDLYDDALHYPRIWTAASSDPAHLEHARFCEFAFGRMPGFQNAIRKMLDAYARGFVVFEKMYAVIDRGEWRGAVVFAELLDKPQHWWSFDFERNLRFRTVANILPGEMVDQGKFVVCTFGTNNTPWGEATLDDVYPTWFLKHHALRNQAIWHEKWAQPLIYGNYPRGANQKASDEARNKLLEVLTTIQSEVAMAFPEGFVPKLLESQRSGAVSFESLITQYTQMESRLVSGQTLTSMGDRGGSHALGRVHERRAENTVDMISSFVADEITILGRELIDRNYGPQDVYPQFQMLTKSLAELQLQANVERAQILNGHKLSRSQSVRASSIVTARDATDELVPLQGFNAPAPSTAAEGLAAPVAVVEPGVPVLLASPAYRDVHAVARKRAGRVRAHLDAVGARATRTAKPAIAKAVRQIASRVRTRKSVGRVTRSFVYNGLKGVDHSGLGDAFMHMLNGPDTPAITGGE